MNHEKLLQKNKVQLSKQKKPYNGKTDNMKREKKRGRTNKYVKIIK